MQQSVTVPEDRHAAAAELNEVWRSVQRMENKLDLSISEQSRLAQQYSSMMHQLSMLTQQVSQIAGQVVQLVSQITHIATTNAERDRINADRDRRVDALAQQVANQQTQSRQSSTTTLERLLVVVFGLMLVAMMAISMWGGG